jgi:hypothetical protein
MIGLLLQQRRHRHAEGLRPSRQAQHGCLLGLVLEALQRRGDLLQGIRHVLKDRHEVRRKAGRGCATTCWGIRAPPVDREQRSSASRFACGCSRSPAVPEPSWASTGARSSQPTGASPTRMSRDGRSSKGRRGVSGTAAGSDSAARYPIAAGGGWARARRSERRAPSTWASRARTTAGSSTTAMTRSRPKVPRYARDDSGWGLCTACHPEGEPEGPLGQWQVYPQATE